MLIGADSDNSHIHRNRKNCDVSNLALRCIGTRVSMAVVATVLNRTKSCGPKCSLVPGDFYEVYNENREIQKHLYVNSLFLINILLPISHFKGQFYKEKD